jgi:outer membrane assembly lipoprotein YfgL
MSSLASIRPTARRVRLVAVLALAAAVVACASGERPKPTPLKALEPAISGRVVWSQRIEGGFGPTASVATTGDLFTVASASGVVAALQPETGREVWRVSLGQPLGTGPGTDGRFTAVVGQGGELVVIEGGTVRWRQPLGVRVVTPPLVAGERVFVLAVDRSVHAFDAVDGRRLWRVQRPGDTLLLAQVGVLTPFRDTLVVGQGPRLTGFDPLQGTVRWELPMASPRGSNEIERLADLVGPAARVGNRICARAFQSAVACVDAMRVATNWSRTFGGTQGVELDESFVFAADGADRVSAWRAASGESAWTNETLLYRQLSAPLSVGRAVVFGDVEGIVHFLSRENGQAQLRLTTDGSPVVARPAAIGTTILVLTRAGGLHALRPN